MRKKKAHSAPPESKPEPKYVVVCTFREWGAWRHLAQAFDNVDAAVHYAETQACYNPRIFGLNPEYEYEVTRTVRVKP